MRGWTGLIGAVLLAGCGGGPTAIETSAGRFTVERVTTETCTHFAMERGGGRAAGMLGGDSPYPICGAEFVATVYLTPVEANAFLPDSEPAVLIASDGRNERLISPFGSSTTVQITRERQTFEAWFPISVDATGLRLSWNGGPEVPLPAPQPE